MTNKMAAGWANSGVGAKEARTQGDEYGGGLSGSSRGGGGGNFYELRGPLSTRKIVHSLLPPYPDWAREKGFEASVTVYFIVLPDGSLKQPLIIKKGSGDPRIDELVIKTLKNWRFAKLKTIQEEQWGLITFRFRLQG
jgi:TonB family protein